MNAPTLFAARMPSITREATGLARISLDAPDAVRAAHTIAGQYLMWQPEGAEKPKPMALANAPGAPLELLVKDDAERFPSAGSTAQVTLPTGKGYPLDTIAGRRLLLVGTGSGIAPLVAVVRALLDDARGAKSVALLYGVKSDAHAAYADVRARARSAGFEIVLTATAPSSSSTRKGRVTAHLPAWLDEQTSVFVCGQREMMDEVTRAVVERGVPADRVHKNF